MTYSSPFLFPLDDCCCCCTSLDSVLFHSMDTLQPNYMRHVISFALKCMEKTIPQVLHGANQTEGSKGN